MISWGATTVAIGFAGALLTGGAAGQPRQADLIYVNANVYTLDPRRPRAEAMGMAFDRIVVVGSEAEVRARALKNAPVRDLGGATVLPGLIDAHCHVASLGSYGLGRLDLSEARAFDDVVAAVAERAKTAKPGEWILGGRWDHESWPDKQLPTHEKLSAVSPDNPVWLTRVDGHAGLANAVALKLAGVTAATAAPSGGEIIKHENGQPTGILIDNAEELITKLVGEAGVDTAALILKAQEMCLAAGLTGLHDAGVTPAEVEVYQQLAKSGKLKIRIYAMLAAQYAPEFFAQKGLLIDDHVTVRSAKIYADGALGSRGAWLLEPYADRPTDADGKPYHGLAVTDRKTLRQAATDGMKQGYQVCTHAIGDRANRAALDAYAYAYRRYPRQDHRFRIEHAQLLAPADIPRFAELGVIPSMQPTHCTSDMRWVEDRVGPERAKGAYAWAALRRTGVPIAGGSDFPVESHNPFLGIYAAITRQDSDGQPAGGWHPEQRMTREEALRSFTLDAAYAAFEEQKKGSLEPGKLADFIVIDRDIMTCEPAQIPATRVLRVYIGGEPVYMRVQSEE